MSRLLISEIFVNKTKGYQFGDSGEYEAFTDNRGKLFRSLQQEYGRCVSKMYIDTKDGRTLVTGWVFEKQMCYDDCTEFYVREVWVNVREDTQEEEQDNLFSMVTE